MIKVKLELCVFRRPRNRASSISVMTAFIGMVIILIAALERGTAVPEIFTSVAVLHFIGRGGGFFRPDFFLHGLVDDRAIGTVRID